MRTPGASKETPRAPMRGVVLGALAYTWWGLSPIFWKELHAVQAIDTLGYRVVFTFLFLLAVVAVRGRLQELWRVLSSPGALLTSVATAFLISVNWGVYVWAVASERVTEASLGYFMNPLMTVLLGVFILGESLRRLQWLAVGFAAVGVLWLTLSLGTFPWVSVALAGSFALYGLLRKTMRAGPLLGLSIEMAILIVPAFGLLGARATFQNVELVHDQWTNLFIVLTGAVTAIPLLMFAAAARAIPLTMLGLLQYFAPTLQFLLGVFFYREEFGQYQLYGYGLVWLGLAIFVTEGLWIGRLETHRTRSVPSPRG